MAEIYYADYNDKTLSALYLKKLAAKDYDGAIGALKRMESAGKDPITLYSGYAKTYYAAGLFNNAADAWFSYLTVCKNKARARAYNGLGACYYRMGDKETASYYFNLQFGEAREAFYEYNEVATELFADYTDYKKNYKLVYPYDKADLSELFSETSALMRQGEYRQAADLLCEIPETSSYYRDALIQLSLCYFFSGDEKNALERIEKAVLLNENDPVAICNAINFCLTLNKKKKAAAYIEKLDRINFSENINEFKKAVPVIFEVLPVKAIELAKLYLYSNPYDLTVNFFLGIAEFNAGDYKNAYNRFGLNYRMTDSFVSRYYLTVCEQAEGGNAGEKKLDYTLDLQNSERKKIYEILYSFMKDEDVSCDTSYIPIINYCIQSNLISLQTVAVEMLAGSTDFSATDELKRLLIKSTVFDDVKSHIVGFLSLDAYDGDLSVVINGIFRNIRLYHAGFGGEFEKIFSRAYSFAVSRLFIVENDLSKLRDTAEEMCILSGIYFAEEKIEDERSLAALMFEYSGYKKIVRRRTFASYFDANLTEIKRLKNLFEEAGITSGHFAPEPSEVAFTEET